MTEEKPPGSASKEEGKCGARLHGHNDPLDPRYQRFCSQPAGFGTPHKGTGACRYHGGSVRSHIVKAERVKVKQEVTRLQQELGEPATLRDPYVELWELTAKVKQFSDVAEEYMKELEDINPHQDRAGMEHTREIILMWERAIERTRDTLLAIAKLDLKRRLVELEEDQASLLVEAINSVIRSPEVNMTDAQIELAQGLLRDGLTAILPALKPRGMPDLEEDIFEGVLVE